MAKMPLKTDRVVENTESANMVSMLETERDSLVLRARSAWLGREHATILSIHA